MTKERKLAIQMWKGIRDMLSSSGEVTHGDIASYKYVFCKMHKLHWRNHCWFCHYIPVCNKCPLKFCDGASLYKEVMCDMVEMDIRIEACNGIIRALGGEA